MYYSYYNSSPTPTLPPPPPKDPWDGEEEPQKQPRRKRSGAAVVAIFLAFLLLIAAGTTALAVLNGRITGPELPAIADLLPDLPQSSYDPGDSFGNYDDDYGYGFGDNFPSKENETAETTVDRYPAGDTLDLPLEGVPLSGELTFQNIYTKVLPSIVGIRAYGPTRAATGTGVVLTADGYIITNFHVIEGSSDVEILLQDGYLYDALLVGGDRANDLAVLKINVSGLTPAEFGDSDLLQVGDPTLAIGNPLGEELKNTMTDGIISAINRDVNMDGVTMTLIQTTAALNPGNSGGALINIYGQVVGITNMKMMSDYDTIEGLGFAIPSATVQSVATQLVAHGKLLGRPTLGVTVQNMPEALWSQYDLPDDFEGGVLVVAVQKGSGAHESGVKVGDIIVEADGQSIRSVDDLLAAKDGLGVGDKLKMKLWRATRYRTVTVTLVDQYELDNVKE